MEGNNGFIEGVLKGYDVDAFALGDMSLYDLEFIGMEENTASRFPFAILFGLVLSKSVLDTVTDGPNHLYLHHYRQLNYRLDMIAYFLAREIERNGYKALPFAASQVVDWKNQRAHVSHRKVGVISGMGWAGRNNLLIHPEFGAQMRYNTVLTDMPLTPGNPSAAKTSCGGCRACIDRCPAGAIKEEQSLFDHIGCYNKLTELKNKRNLGHHICGICVEACRGQR